MEPNRYNVLRYTLSKDQIMTFVGGLHDIQADMIEVGVTLAQERGFPEANEIINNLKAPR
jgi:hypothetical protein